MSRRPKSLDFEEFLRRTLDDRQLSRAERQVLSGFVAGEVRGQSHREQLVGRAFDLAAQAVEDPRDRPLLTWLEAVLRPFLAPPEPEWKSEVAESFFAPEDDCPARVRRLLDGAQRSLEVCVFTITDDCLTGSLLEAHRRGVAVHILSDDDKALDPGSDLRRLAAAGIAVRTDRSVEHMHHKFVLVDRRLLLTGSYNWTRSAAWRNHENFLITDDPRLVGSFAREFERLWERYCLPE